ncbi:MAG: hypothetical protein WC729_27850 [Sphingomonas sp.]|uniref:hypothetical protein n=1 Tax=Sphingomonas sp. TaxID=28214 RepID=UPI003563EF45
MREGLRPFTLPLEVVMKKRLICNACGAELTGALRILSGKDPSVTSPEHVDRAPLTEPGVAFKSYEPIMRSFGDAPAPLEFTPQYWLNPDDLTDAVGNTPDNQHLSGCCGMGGFNGPNQICRCGAEIGTLQTDCVTPRVFIPEPGKTAWIENFGTEE